MEHDTKFQHAVIYSFLENCNEHFIHGHYVIEYIKFRNLISDECIKCSHLILLYSTQEKFEDTLLNCTFLNLYIFHAFRIQLIRVKLTLNGFGYFLKVLFCNKALQMCWYLSVSCFQIFGLERSDKGKSGKERWA